MYNTHTQKCGEKKKRNENLTEIILGVIRKESDGLFDAKVRRNVEWSFSFGIFDGGIRVGVFQDQFEELGELFLAEGGDMKDGLLALVFGVGEARIVLGSFEEEADEHDFSGGGSGMSNGSVERSVFVHRVLHAQVSALFQQLG
jgi:hypothetical protein